MLEASPPKSTWLTVFCIEFWHAGSELKLYKGRQMINTSRARAWVWDPLMSSASSATLVVNSLAEDVLAINYLHAAMFAVSRSNSHVLVYVLTIQQLLAWDLLLCFTADLNMAFVFGLSTSMLAYFISR